MSNQGKFPATQDVLATSVGDIRRRYRVAEQKEFDMPQMFDWIFFAIINPCSRPPGLGLASKPLGANASPLGLQARGSVASGDGVPRQIWRLSDPPSFGRMPLCSLR